MSAPAQSPELTNDIIQKRVGQLYLDLAAKDAYIQQLLDHITDLEAKDQLGA